jgi:PAS domain S-box-containing protein
MITETSLDVLCFFRRDGVFAYVSRAFADVLGFPPESVVGTHFRDYFEPVELGSAAALFKRVASGERIPPLEVTARHRDGHAVPMEVSAVPVVRAGQVLGVYGIARDVTRRRRAEEGLRWYSGQLERLLKEGDDRERLDREAFAAHLRRHQDTEAALRDAEDLLRAAIETSPLGVAIVGVDGRVLWPTRRFLELSGRSPARVDGRRLDALIHPADRKGFALVQHEVATGKVDFGRFDARFAAGSAAAGPMRFSLALVRHVTGEPRCLVVAAELSSPGS